MEQQFLVENIRYFSTGHMKRMCCYVASYYCCLC